MKHAFLKTSTALAALASLALPLSAWAVTREVIVDQNNPGIISTEMPAGGSHFDGGDTLIFRVINPTPNAVAFTMPSLGINYPVPANMERSFYVNGADVTSPQLTYNVADPNGAQLASGTLTDDDALSGSDSLASLINYDPNYTAEAKPEPRYNTNTVMERPTSYQTNTVRGYW